MINVTFLGSSRAHRPGCRVGVLAAALLVLAGCGGASSDTSDAAAPGVASDAATGPATQASPSTSARPAPVEPVTFFRAQAPGCRAHAKQYGNPQVESARFIRATLVDALGGGAYLIRDGLGTRLVVRPTDRVVLPESGKETDLMPAPYGTGCPPEVFKGSAD